MRSPKDKYMGRVLLKKPLKGVGSEIMFTANSIDQLISYASEYNAREYSLIVSENKKAYPEFEWVEVKVVVNHPGRGGARDGAGRPTLYSDKKRVQVMLSEDNADNLDAYAKEQKVSKSDCLNYILDDFFSNIK